MKIFRMARGANCDVLASAAESRGLYATEHFRVRMNSRFKLARYEKNSPNAGSENKHSDYFLDHEVFRA